MQAKRRTTLCNLGRIFAIMLLRGRAGPEDIKLFMLISTEHEINHAHKC